MNQLIDTVLSERGLLMWRRRWLIQYSSLCGAQWQEVRRCWVLLFQSSRGTRRSMADFGRHLTLLCPLWRPWLSGKTTGAYLLPVCWLIYCSPTRRWEINGKPSVRRQYNKWPIQTSTYSAPEGSPRSQSQRWQKKTWPFKPPQGHRLVKLYVTMWENAAGQCVCRGRETTPQIAQGLGKKCFIILSSRPEYEKNSWVCFFKKYILSKKITQSRPGPIHEWRECCFLSTRKLSKNIYHDKPHTKKLCFRSSQT